MFSKHIGNEAVFCSLVHQRCASRIISFFVLVANSRSLTQERCCILFFFKFMYTEISNFHASNSKNVHDLFSYVVAITDNNEQKDKKAKVAYHNLEF